jgi:hypothetical protein
MPKEKEKKLPEDGLAETCWSNKENYSAPVGFNTLDHTTSFTCQIHFSSAF